MSAKKAIFLDKDGTLIVDVPYNVNPELIVLADNCLKGLKQLQDDGYLLVIISNQAGVAKGYFTETALLAVEQRLKALLTPAGILLSGFYYCPHQPKDNCNCRKPAPGMFFKAARDLGIALDYSWMIGDILNDIEAGTHAGCKGILIDNGNETEWQMNTFRKPATICRSIDDAANFILNQHDEQLAGL